MRAIGGQGNRLPLLHFETFIGDLNVRVAIKNNNECVEWRGMLAQAFTFSERKQGDRAAFVLQ